MPKSKMTEIEKKIHELAKKNPPSQWRRRLAYDTRNWAWLKMSSNVALAILDILDERKMSKGELAKRMKVSEAQVNKIVIGRENLTLKMISKIEEALGIKLGKVLNDDVD